MPRKAGEIGRELDPEGVSHPRQNKVENRLTRYQNGLYSAPGSKQNVKLVSLLFERN
jgi:hypothetical protein